MTSKQSFALLFSTLLAGLVSSEFTLKVEPVPLPPGTNDSDDTIFLQIDSTTLKNPEETAACAALKGPFGKSGTVETNSETGSLEIIFALPKEEQLKTGKPNTAKFQLKFENDLCNSPDSITYEEDEVELTSNRMGVSEGELGSIVEITSCSLFVDVSLSFEDCQNWHGGEGSVFELKVNLTDGDAGKLAGSYKFVPCQSFIKFEYPERTRNLESISYVEDCPYVMNEDGSCQVCPTSDASAALKPDILGVAILAFAQFIFLVS
jgi:hypothetical protein